MCMKLKIMQIYLNHPEKFQFKKQSDLKKRQLSHLDSIEKENKNYNKTCLALPPPS